MKNKALIIPVIAVTLAIVLVSLSMFNRSKPITREDLTRVMDSLNQRFDSMGADWKVEKNQRREKTNNLQDQLNYLKLQLKALADMKDSEGEGTVGALDTIGGGAPTTSFEDFIFPFAETPFVTGDDYLDRILYGGYRGANALANKACDDIFQEVLSKVEMRLGKILPGSVRQQIFQESEGYRQELYAQYMNVHHQRYQYFTEAVQTGTTQISSIEHDADGNVQWVMPEQPVGHTRFGFATKDGFLMVQPNAGDVPCFEHLDKLVRSQEKELRAYVNSRAQESLSD